jgi:hypothetical protein
MATSSAVRMTGLSKERFGLSEVGSMMSYKNHKRMLGQFSYLVVIQDVLD